LIPALRTVFCLKGIAHKSFAYRTSPIDDDKYQQADDNQREDRSPNMFGETEKDEIRKSEKSHDQQAHCDDKDRYPSLFPLLKILLKMPFLFFCVLIGAFYFILSLFGRYNTF
jgi:hypothetical protein